MTYSPEMVALLQQLRARVFAEFGFKMRLVDPRLLDALGELGRKSRDPFTRKTVVKIMALANISYLLDDGNSMNTSAEKAENPSFAMSYRGNKMARPRRDGHAEPSEVVASSARQTEDKVRQTENKVVKQIYRGHVVIK